MKMVLGFFIGVITVTTLLFGVQFFTPIFAQTEEETTGLTELVPDIDKIYREALITPLLEAEKTIWDEDIAEYYHLLLQRCNFTEEEREGTASPPPEPAP